MDYAPYLVVCRDQTLASAYETFQWHEIVPRHLEKTTRDRIGCRDVNSTKCLRTTQVPSAWRRFSSVSEISSALDSVKSALTWRRATADKHGIVAAGQSESTEETQPVKRSTKKVCFADEVGLELTTVRVVSSYLRTSNSYLRKSSSNSSIPLSSNTRSVVAPRFLLEFAQPWTCSDTFRVKVETCDVILSNFVINNSVINGEIEVKNVAYEKTVFVRYTTSDWKSFSDVGASYVARSERRFSGYDTFSFQFPVSLDPEKPGRLEFAICYAVSGQTFWDNNSGSNYSIVKIEEPRTTTTKKSVDEVVFQDFQSWRMDTTTHSRMGGSGCRKVVKPGRRQQQRNTTDRIVFSVVHTKPVVWTEFIGWKWDMDCNCPYW